MIKEQGDAKPAAEVCGKRGQSQGTCYKFTLNDGGMEVSDATKLRALEDENAKLKRLLSDSMLSNDVLKDFLGNGPDTLPCRCSVGSTVALVLPMECRDGAKT